mmetsp:Transcript_3289/g.6122  ORF Transcript_3289/g.6122 Transcript_3289/m.6122 type:complete len:80 (-) Transcript_3289:160-399(-)
MEGLNYYFLTKHCVMLRLVLTRIHLPKIFTQTPTCTTGQPTTLQMLCCMFAYRVNATQLSKDIQTNSHICTLQTLKILC